MFKPNCETDLNENVYQSYEFHQVSLRSTSLFFKTYHHHFFVNGLEQVLNQYFLTSVETSKCEFFSITPKNILSPAMFDIKFATSEQPYLARTTNSESVKTQTAIIGLK